MTGHLKPGESQTFFLDNVSPTSVRAFTAVPINTLIDDFVLYDQFVEISQVFHILKGKNHTLDGTGGAGTWQVNFTVHNRDRTNPADFEVYMAEIT
jgi:hypothetical protein